MSACAIRKCSTSCHRECSVPCGNCPRIRAGIPFTALSKPTCASSKSSSFTSCARNAFSFTKSPIHQFTNCSEHAYEIRSRDDERLVGLEVAHQHRRILRRDHRLQQIDGRRDVDEWKRRLHD